MRIAAAMLRALGIDEVRLLTNNPAKVAGLEAAGIAVVERVAHHMPVNPHNADYLATKKRQERAPGLIFEQRASRRAPRSRRASPPSRNRRYIPMLSPVTS